MFVDKALSLMPKMKNALKLKKMCEEKMSFGVGTEASKAPAEIFLVYRDGRLIYHSTGSTESTIDDLVLSSMLTAIQNFVKDSFRFQEGEENIDRLEIGQLKILIEYGKLIYLAAVFRGDEPPGLREKMQSSLVTIHDRWYDQLKAWTGSLEVFNGVEDIIEAMRKE